MTAPTLVVEVGFTSPATGTALHLDDVMRGKLDTATLAPDDLWTDVTQWVQRVQTRRGATQVDSPLLRYEQGTTTIVLRNDDRRFDPTNLAGPYVVAGRSQVEPMRAVRIRARHSGVTYPLWRGFSDRWTVGYDGPESSYVTLTCVDGFGVFNSFDRGESVATGAGEDSGARVGRILDSVAWPTADRMIATGDSVLQATTLSGDALSELQLTADSELGEFYMDAEGRARFRNRLALGEELRSARPVARLAGTGDTTGVPTTVSLVANPSVETGLHEWSTGGSVAPTIVQSNSRARFGTYSVLATWGAGGSLPHVRYDIRNLTGGHTYTISVWLWVPSGSLPVTIVAEGTFGGTTSTTDAWERITWTGPVAGTTTAMGLWPVGSPVGGETFYVDGLQVEEGAVATAYVDGALAIWDGPAHASTSRRLPELPYADVDLTTATEGLFNLVSVGRVGGTAQVVEDPASRTAYLTRSFTRTDLLLTTDAECLQLANAILGQSSRPRVRASSMRLRPARDDRLWPQALGREIGDRLAVTRTPPGGGAPIEREVWLRGVEHQVVNGLTDWTTTWVFQAADASTWLVLDNPASGLLDVNILAY